MEHNIKAIKKKFHDAGVYYTPPELVELMKKYADQEKPNPKNVYDPTCGAGDLLSVFGCPKYGQEIDSEQLEYAKKLPGFTGYAGDTLADPAFLDMKFDLIMANYPFSIKWTPKEDERFAAPVLPPPSKADWAFLMHILHYLEKDGVAVVMCFPGIMYRAKKEGQIRKWFVEENYIDRVVYIPGGYFVDTKIATNLLILKKNKTDTRIRFEDLENGLHRDVDVQEVKENNYTLSVNLYLQPEIEEEPIDVRALEIHARECAIKRIVSAIRFSKMTCDLDKDLPPVEDFIDQIIESVIKEKKQLF